jgi:2-polyprenyl-6-methoxyphenol hydroxylase-like FAD-dependent oxidoreductase
MSDASDAPLLIVGGGPAGMLLAHLLVEGGQPVHVIERHPDFAREFRGEGIQVSVLRLLREMGMLDELLAAGIARPARAARVFLDDDPVATLMGEGADDDFGLILHQAEFLSWLHSRLERSPLYRASLGTSVTDVVRDEAGTLVGLAVRRGTQTDTIAGRSVVVAAGRKSPLRDRLGLEVKTVDTHFNVLWLRLDPPVDPTWMPDGFRAHLSGDALFILYGTANGGLQIAWGRRDERGLMARDPATRKRLLLADAPPSLRALLEEHVREGTTTHFLRVQSDRLLHWFKDGVLFIGDAAHTMSPVAGQGINLAMRDAVVAATHVLAARKRGHALDEAGARAFQREREPEVRAMQRFQRGLGYFMLGAPRWQVRLFFRAALPILGLLGVRQRLLRRMQAGVVRVALPSTALASTPTFSRSSS